MLKKIPTSQVRIGMFVQAFEGSWLSHPFWKSKFVLQEQADLDALRASGVSEVWVDFSKSVAPTPPGAPAATAAAPASAAATPGTPGEATPGGPRATSLAGEIQRASEVMKRSREAVAALFSEARMGRAVDAEQCLPVVADVATSLARNPSALISLARLKTKDDYTYMHSVAVCALMVSLARQLGLDEAQTREAGLGGLLHDIGKMLVPLEVLNKPGALSDAEFGLVRLHPERGHAALARGKGVPSGALEICLRHHEKMDGSGYPGRFQGDQISLLARMGAVCDVYDAITSHRPYKSAWDPAGSLQRMSQWQGHFDPVVFQAFVKTVGIYPVGTLVRLQSGRLAVVIEQNPDALVKPVVRVFYAVRERQRLREERLDLSQPDVDDRILGRELPKDWGLGDLTPLWKSA